MNGRTAVTLFFFLAIPGVGAAQFDYPYAGFHDNNDLQAYWYDIPEDSVTTLADGQTYHFYPTLQIYGRAPGEDFEVIAEVFLAGGREVLAKTFHVVGRALTDSLSADMGYSNGFFRIVHRVDQLSEYPEMIRITLRSAEGERSREVRCRYHRLYGRITNFQGRPFRAYVSIRPDAFNPVTSVWTDDDGNYEMILPERTYNAVYVDDETYLVSSLEAWGWHIIMDNDQRLDFQVGTGEVYNLNVWSNNGGYFTYFVSFRPMALIPEDEREGTRSTVRLNEKDFQMSKLAPDLEIGDVTVRINGEAAKILSLQRYFETGSDSGIQSYLLQVDKSGTPRNGRITLEVAWEKEMEIGGSIVKRNAMGIFQLLPNYAGMSNYH